jgi:hypothetical protein
MDTVNDRQPVANQVSDDSWLDNVVTSEAKKDPDWRNKALSGMGFTGSNCTVEQATAPHKTCFLICSTSFRISFVLIPAS